VVKKNPGASVVDLGDGVAAIELHSKMNALGEDIVSLITQTLKPRERLSRTLKRLLSLGIRRTFLSART
jgi:3-hydroxyacyl-CoA dehydrogenase